MGKVHNDNAIWVFCCCGCLPWAGFAKGVLFGIPAAILVGCSVTIISIICLPHDIYLIFRCALSSVVLGRNLRLLTLILTPFAGIVYLPACCLLSFTCSVVFYFSKMMISVFDDDTHILFGKVTKMYSDCYGIVLRFYRFHTELVQLC